MQKNGRTGEKPPIGTILNLVGTADVLVEDQPTAVLAVTQWCGSNQTGSKLFVVRADTARASNIHQVEPLVLLPGVIAITNTGVTPIIISKEEHQKTEEFGVSATDFRVGVVVNESKYEAVLIADGTR